MLHVTLVESSIRVATAPGSVIAFHDGMLHVTLVESSIRSLPGSVLPFTSPLTLTEYYPPDL
jgi:hypothetical protein